MQCLNCQLIDVRVSKDWLVNSLRQNKYIVCILPFKNNSLKWIVLILYAFHTIWRLCKLQPNVNYKLASTATMRRVSKAAVIGGGVLGWIGQVTSCCLSWSFFKVLQAKCTVDQWCLMYSCEKPTMWPQGALRHIGARLYYSIFDGRLRKFTK